MPTRLIDATLLQKEIFAKIKKIKKANGEYDINHKNGYMQAMFEVLTLVKNARTED